MAWNFDKDEYESSKQTSYEWKKETWTGSPIPKVEKKITGYQLVGQSIFIDWLRKWVLGGWTATQINFSKRYEDKTEVFLSRKGCGNERVTVSEVYLKPIYGK